MAFVHDVVKKRGHYRFNPNWKQERAEADEKALRNQEAQKQKTDGIGRDDLSAISPSVA